MSDAEDEIADYLRRRADAVEPRFDIDGVKAGRAAIGNVRPGLADVTGTTVAPRARGLSRRVVLAAVAVVALLLVGGAVIRAGSGERGVETSGGSGVPSSRTTPVTSTSVAAVDSSGDSTGGDPRSSYRQQLGGEAVVRAHSPEDLEEFSLHGLAHLVSTVDVSEVLYRRDLEQLGEVVVPELSRGTLAVFEVLGDGDPRPSVFEGIDPSSPFYVVLDYSFGTEQAERTGGWSVHAVAVADETGDLTFLGPDRQPVSTFFDEARNQFVPGWYGSDEALLIALVSESADTFSTGEPGPLGRAVIDALTPPEPEPFADWYALPPTERALQDEVAPPAVLDSLASRQIVIEVERSVVDADHSLRIGTPEGILYVATLESERFAGVYAPETPWTVTIDDGLGNELLRDLVPAESWQGLAATKFVVEVGPDGELVLAVQTIDQAELNALLESWATSGSPGPENP